MPRTLSAPQRKAKVEVQDPTPEIGDVIVPEASGIVLPAPTVPKARKNAPRAKMIDTKKEEQAIEEEIAPQAKERQSKIKHSAMLGNIQAFFVDPKQVQIVDGINPRHDLDLVDLKDYIRVNGCAFPPILVFQEEGALKLAEGHRRLAATCELVDEGVPLQGIPAMWADSKNTAPERLLLANLTSNQGKPLSALEQAEGIAQLLKYNWKQTDIARLMGKSAPWVTQRLSLLEASDEVREALQEGTLKATEAQSIVQQSKKTTGTKAQQQAQQAQAVVHAKAKRRVPRPRQGNGSQGGRRGRPAVQHPQQPPTTPHMPTSTAQSQQLTGTTEKDPAVRAIFAQLDKYILQARSMASLQHVLTALLNYEQSKGQGEYANAIRTCIARCNGEDSGKIK